MGPRPHGAGHSTVHRAACQHQLHCIGQATPKEREHALCCSQDLSHLPQKLRGHCTRLQGGPGDRAAHFLGSSVPVPDCTESVAALCRFLTAPNQRQQLDKAPGSHPANLIQQHCCPCCKNASLPMCGACGGGGGGKTRSCAAGTVVLGARSNNARDLQGEAGQRPRPTDAPALRANSLETHSRPETRGRSANSLREANLDEDAVAREQRCLLLPMPTAGTLPQLPTSNLPQWIEPLCVQLTASSHQM